MPKSKEYGSLRLMSDVSVVMPCPKPEHQFLLMLLCLWCTPSKRYMVNAKVETIAKAVCVKDLRVIRRYLDWLEENGWIQRQTRWNDTTLIFIAAGRIRKLAESIHRQRVAEWNGDVCTLEQPELEPVDTSDVPLLDAPATVQSEQTSMFATQKESALTPKLSAERLRLEKKMFISSLEVFPELADALGDDGMRKVAEAIVRAEISEPERIVGLFRLRDRLHKVTEAKKPVNYLISSLKSEIAEARNDDANGQPVTPEGRAHWKSLHQEIRDTQGWRTNLSHLELWSIEQVVEAARQDLAGYTSVDALRVWEENGQVYLLHVLTDPPTPNQSAS